MPRFIVHIGTHKTATTSIQRHLAHHRDTLAERGVFYPDYSIIGRKPHYAHLGMVNALSGRHKVYPVAAAEKFFAEVHRQASGYDTTVISAEPFYRHVQNDPDDGPKYDPDDYWPLRNAYIERIRDLLGGDVQIVVVFRRQAEYAHSLYQEHVKVTRYNGNFRTFLREFWYHFTFLQQAQAWDRVFPGLKAMSFDRLIRTGDAVAEFCRLLDLPVEGLEQPLRANEGLPVDLVILKRMLHRTSENKEAVRKKLERITEHLSPETQEMFRTRSFFASQDDLLKFQVSFDTDNEDLRPYLLHEDAATGPIFREGVKPGQRYGDQLNPQFLLDLLELGLQGLPEATSVLQD